MGSASPALITVLVFKMTFSRVSKTRMSMSIRGYSLVWIRVSSTHSLSSKARLLEAGSSMPRIRRSVPSGATLVYSRRILNHKVGLLYSAGPDTQSFAFSMTLYCYGARMWVHWCKVQPGKAPAGAQDNTFLANVYYETYHMVSLASYDYYKLEDVKDLTKTLNSILDWGDP